MNMDRKDCSEVSSIKLKLNKLQCQPTRKTISCKIAKFCQQHHMNTLTSLENNESFYSIADFFVRFTKLSERKVSLQEEKSNVSSRRIRVK